MKSTEILYLLKKLDENFMISRNGGFGFYNISLSEYANEIIAKSKKVSSEDLVDLIIGQIQIDELMEKYSNNNYYFANFANSQSQVFEIEDDLKRLNSFAREFVDKNNVVEQLKTNLINSQRNQANKKEVVEKKKIGFIYLIKSELGCKIGKTKNIKQREKHFTVKMPFEFHFEDYKQCLDYHTIELELHEKYKERRINGEWFNLDEKDINEIKDYLSQIAISPAANKC